MTEVEKIIEKQKRKKIAKLALKLYLAEIAGGQFSQYEGWMEVAERIFDKQEKYINEASEPEPSTEQIEPETETEPEPETDISDFSWAKWVATDATEAIFAYKYKPTKSVVIWNEAKYKYTCITPGQALALCGRVPEWSDEEPTPVKNK